MEMDKEQIFQAAFALPLEKRAELFEALCHSVDSDQLGLDDALLADPSHRDLEMEDGTVPELFYDDVTSEIRKNLK